MLRRLLKSRFLLPVAVMAAVGLGTAASVASGAAAQGTTHPQATTTTVPQATTTTLAGQGSRPPAQPFGDHIASKSGRVASVSGQVAACHRSIAQVSYPSPPNSGSPGTSSHRTCANGRVVSYGSKAITYNSPPRSFVQAGEELFQQNCSSCHQADAQGGPAAPSLIGVGPATVDFWVSTGRMPAATPLSTQATAKPPRLNDRQAREIAAFITSLTPAAPFIPTVHLKHANLATGATLFALDCAACHTITGMGDALAYGTYAPSLHHPTATQIAEAIRTGPANMPRFTGNLSDSQVRDIVAYVSEKIQHPSNPGGFGLGGIGPVAEGFVGLLFGVGGLLLVCYWIGDRS